MDKLWDYIIDTQIATEDELRLVTCMNGYNEETLSVGHGMYYIEV